MLEGNIGGAGLLSVDQPIDVLLQKMKDLAFAKARRTGRHRLTCLAIKTQDQALGARVGLQAHLYLAAFMMQIDRFGQARSASGRKQFSQKSIISL